MASSEKMTGLFVFDQQNDIVFTQLDGHIKNKLFEIAKKQELLPDDTVGPCIHQFQSFRFEIVMNEIAIEFTGGKH